MTNDPEVGVESLRSFLGILQNDPKFFRPFTMVEVVVASTILKQDAGIPEDVRKCMDVGIALDLMPSHLTPNRDVLARHLSISSRTVRRRQIAWECVEPVLRFSIITRAARLSMMLRSKLSD